MNAFFFTLFLEHVSLVIETAAPLVAAKAEGVEPELPNPILGELRLENDRIRVVVGAVEALGPEVLRVEHHAVGAHPDDADGVAAGVVDVEVGGQGSNGCADDTHSFGWFVLWG